MCECTNRNSEKGNAKTCPWGGTAPVTGWGPSGWKGLLNSTRACWGCCVQFWAAQNTWPYWSKSSKGAVKTFTNLVHLVWSSRQSRDLVSDFSLMKERLRGIKLACINSCLLECVKKTARLFLEDLSDRIRGSKEDTNWNTGNST